MDRATSRGDMVWCWSCNANHTKAQARRKHPKRAMVRLKSQKRNIKKTFANTVY